MRVYGQINWILGYSSPHFALAFWCRACDPEKKVKLLRSVGPFQRFLAAVLFCSMLAIVGLGFAVDRLLTRNLFDREAQVTAEAVRVLANVDLTPAQFRFAAANRRTGAFAHLAMHLMSIPEILQVRIYDSDGTIVWTTEGDWAPGQPYANPELAAALKGDSGVNIGAAKVRHSLRAVEGGHHIVDVYVPLVNEGGKVYAVFELSKHPVTFFRAVASARRMVWFISLGVGAVLVLLLARIFLHAERNEMRLQAENREIEAQLVQAAKLSVVGEMAASVAHEINNPLGILTGTTNELRAAAGRHGCPQLCREDLAILDREIWRIAQVVRDLLLFARKSDRALVPTDINQVLEGTARFVKPSFERAQVTLVPEYHPRPLRVLADDNQLKQVFLNLLQNAKDAMPEGGTIRLRTSQENGHVQVEVIDSGTGIPPENIGRLFEPFFSTKRSANGSGLGLPVSRGIVSAHGGRIEVSSTVGHGSVFRVVIPALA